MPVRITTLSGDEKTIGDETLTELDGSLRGSLASPGEPAYEEARTLWNAMVDRRPGLAVRCRGTSDVQRAVRFARENDLLTAVRAGGHNIAGKAVEDGALLIDLSPMKSVWVDPSARVARVEPGASLGDFDREAQVFGLATPTGINSTTGISGLTLGGGFGWLTRRHGMTVDNLLSADVVTADGRVVTASEFEEPELFWGLRGGSGNFGVVTSYEFELHPVGPTILSGLIVHPFDDAEGVLHHWRDFAEEMDDDTNVWVVMRKAPPLPFLPEEVHGTPVVVLAAFHGGDMEAGEKALAPLREYGEPIADVIGPHPYVGWQAAFDPLLTPGARNYWKSHNYLSMDDEVLDDLTGWVESLPTPMSEIFLARLGGAASRVPVEATAYPHRDVQYVMNVHTRWEDAAEDDQHRAWAREVFDAMAPNATGGAYLNFMSEDEGAGARAYGANQDRLAALKRVWDPDNAFRLNHNVEPS